MRLARIQNESPKIPDLVMQSLIKAIEDGHIQVGKELPSERDLAEDLGVGRGSLRECLAVLDFLGAIESKGNRKKVVRDAHYIRRSIAFIKVCSGIDTQEKFMEFRRINESHIAELACQNATEEDLEAIRLAVQHLDERPWDGRADVEFHEALAAASHSEVFEVTLQLFISMISDFRNRFYSLSDYISQARESHMAIYEAVRDRDVAKARYEVERHLLIAQSFIEQHPEL
jgi:GntR family transcriptional repressor for pyruvate dehydrogenase complex